jgi:hypothetical protein
MRGVQSCCVFFANLTNSFGSSDNHVDQHSEALVASSINRNRHVNFVSHRFSVFSTSPCVWQRLHHYATLQSSSYFADTFMAAALAGPHAACPLFGHHSQYLQLHAQLRLRPFHSAHKLAVWLWRDERSGDGRSTCRGQRSCCAWCNLGLSLCLSSSCHNAPLCCLIIRRCLSTRGADRLLRYL